ncbi:hypothetical protein DFH06DRAFT_1473180, partial [Mycena polygramma]
PSPRSSSHLATLPGTLCSRLLIYPFKHPRSLDRCWHQDLARCLLPQDDFKEHLARCQQVPVLYSRLALSPPSSTASSHCQDPSFAVKLPSRCRATPFAHVGLFLSLATPRTFLFRIQTLVDATHWHRLASRSYCPITLPRRPG